MMDYTDRHYRYLMRLLCPQVLLYTEMVTAMALAHGDTERLLAFDKTEHSLVLQLGGSDPLLLAQATCLAAAYGYDAVNLNVGCPSPRVQEGSFGACLMAEPDLVVDCVKAMQEASALPVTVKTRLGIGRVAATELLYPLIEKLAAAKVNTFIIHARNAWLEGLSPKENRTVPPLNYEAVHQLQRDFPELSFVLNGGVQSLEDIVHLASQFSGVMVGRAAYHDPYLIAKAERALYPTNTPLPNRTEVVRRYYHYASLQLATGSRLYPLLKPLLGLFLGEPKGRLWRRLLSGRGQDNPEIILRALEQVTC
jgi:tRNA-dihydrouridine synthase A